MSSIADLKRLSTDEEVLFRCIEQGQAEECINLVRGGHVRLNCLDKNGMNPLDMACFKGDERLAKFLLNSGADVNNRAHEQGYTCLMFAALSRKPALCQLLLEAGCRSYSQNNLGKTATELAAFVGHHECVSAINSFISLSYVDEIIHPNGADSEKIYPPELAILVHKLVKDQDFHPIRLVFKVSDESCLLKCKQKLIYTIDRLFEKQLRNKKPDEVMSLKLWLILFTMRDLLKFLEQCNSSNSTSPAGAQLCRLYAKRMLAMSPGDVVRPGVGAHLRMAILAFPYKQSLLHQTLLKSMKYVGPGQKPGAYILLCEALFGNRYARTGVFCWTCGTASAMKRCKNCKIPYCSPDCQKFDWQIHKHCCEAIKERMEEEHIGGQESVEEIELAGE